MNPTTRKMTLTAGLIALAVSVNYLLASIPNVELMTALIFVTGALLGWKYGLAAGLIAEGLFSIFNPFGPAPLPVFMFQVLGMMVAGLVGGMVSPVWLQKSTVSSPVRYGLLGGLGALLSLQFDLMTTLGTALAMGFSGTGFIGLLTIGMVFYAIHVISNAIIFAVLVPVLVRVMQERIPSRFEPTQTKPIEPTPTCEG